MSLKDTKAFPDGARGKVPVCQCRRVLRDTGSTPGSGRSPGEGHGNPLQYSCLENPMDRGTWRATIHRVPKSQTQPKRLSTQRIHKDKKSLEGNSSLWTFCDLWFVWMCYSLRGTAREGLSLGSCSALCRALGHVPKLPVPPPWRIYYP